MMMVLLDTNILVRWSVPSDPSRPIVIQALRDLRRRGHRLVVCPQNLIELWSVATRPAASNGLGLSPERADRLIRRFTPLCLLLDEVPAIFDHWRRLVVQCAVSGRQVHDARLAAVMITYRISHI